MTKLKEFAALTRVIRDISQLVFVELDASYQEELKNNASHAATCNRMKPFA